jgi:hypothetical protein
MFFQPTQNKSHDSQHDPFFSLNQPFFVGAGAFSDPSDG